MANNNIKKKCLLFSLLVLGTDAFMKIKKYMYSFITAFFFSLVKRI